MREKSHFRMKKASSRRDVFNIKKEISLNTRRVKQPTNNFLKWCTFIMLAQIPFLSFFVNPKVIAEDLRAQAQPLTKNFNHFLHIRITSDRFQRRGVVCETTRRHVAENCKINGKNSTLSPI